MSCDVRIRGEYWITNDGSVFFADGDSGDYNHTAFALQHAIDLVYDSADADPVASALLHEVGADAASWDGDVTAFREALLNASDLLSVKYPELCEDYRPCLLRAGVAQSALDAMWCANADARLWAVTECGWMIVKSNQVVLYGLTDTRVKVLRDGLWDILLQEGLDELEDYECEVVDSKTRKRYTVSLASLEGGSLADIYPMADRLAAALNGR